MVEYILNMLNDILEDIKGDSATPDAHQPFHIVEDVNKLSQTDAEFFHHVVEQLMYLSKQARPDIKLEVSVLFIRLR